ADFAPVRPEYRVLFNSYYLGVGAMHPRPERGLLSRPSLDEVLAYRREVERRLLRLVSGPPLAAALLDLIELGLHHEQQHQELILTDLKHHFSRHPLLPAYRPSRKPVATAGRTGEAAFRGFAGGLAEIGHAGGGFAFDNERPWHRVWLEPFSLAARPVTNREYLRFMADGGYGRGELWLSEGWETVRREGWTAPLYWKLRHGEWSMYTLDGEAPLDPEQPVCHVSYYEADAYARWAGARLPSEAEWEHAAQTVWPAAALAGNFVDSGLLHPCALTGDESGLGQLFGDVWEWTRSAHLPYPGYRPAAGAVGEYNGKFMINQMVLRGGSCATPASHMRPSYRNFFPPGARWQFSGIRLARDP
ncbi:MAG TPA: ergothioneine biosynthesis protein EgtB, partial [Rhodocyclaceae bacterium]|nr:ergothioneine biosynthesis protein EgtB [Rhodocyclaceae bacterium]